MKKRASEHYLNLYEAKTSLSALVERASKGEEFVIGKAGRPMAKLVPVRHVAKLRRPGGWNGKAFIAADFDGPLPQEIAAAFEGGNEEQ